MRYAPAPAEAARLVSVGDAKLHVIDLGDQNATPVVFLHGGGPGCNAWTDWQQIGERLGDGYRRLYIDFPYYGDSSPTPIQGPIWTGLANLLTGVLESVDVSRAHFVCQSFGGAAAIVLAVERPELFLSLALTGTVLSRGVLTPPIADRVVRDAVGPYLDGGPTRDKMRTLLAAVEWFDASAIPDELVEARYQASSRAEHIERFTRQPDVMGEAQDLDPVLHLNHVPTLLAYGDRDPFAPAEVPLYLFTRFPRARLVLVKDGAHHFPEEIPDTYLAVLTPWLREHHAVDG
ncbi:alpha/beta fold hydrolase [Nocardia sp. R7R-8]|uniref:alpha/beta fold hydrolase n=1 Tax=Nocardia sp. R7R-8 TaxID=3459304 RepID=UPI00403DDA67